MTIKEAIRHEKPPVCLHILGQNLVNNLHAESRELLKQRDELLAACNKLVESTIQGHPDPRAALQDAIALARAALANVKAEGE